MLRAELALARQEKDKVLQEKDQVQREKDQALREKAMFEDALCATQQNGFDFAYLQHCTNDFAAPRLLGEGAFGRVYRGFDPELRTQFAVKRLAAETLTMDLRHPEVRRPQQQAAAAVRLRLLRGCGRSGPSPRTHIDLEDFTAVNTAALLDINKVLTAHTPVDSPNISRTHSRQSSSSGLVFARAPELNHDLLSAKLRSLHLDARSAPDLSRLIAQSARSPQDKSPERPSPLGMPAISSDSDQDSVSTTSE